MALRENVISSQKYFFHHTPRIETNIGGMRVAVKQIIRGDAAACIGIEKDNIRVHARCQLSLGSKIENPRWTCRHELDERMQREDIRSEQEGKTVLNAADPSPCFLKVILRFHVSRAGRMV